MLPTLNADDDASCVTHILFWSLSLDRAQEVVWYGEKKFSCFKVRQTKVQILTPLPAK